MTTCICAYCKQPFTAPSKEFVLCRDCEWLDMLKGMHKP